MAPAAKIYWLRGSHVPRTLCSIWYVGTIVSPGSQSSMTHPNLGWGPGQWCIGGVRVNQQRPTRPAHDKNISWLGMVMKFKKKLQCRAKLDCQVIWFVNGVLPSLELVHTNATNPSGSQGGDPTGLSSQIGGLRAGQSTLFEGSA